MTIDYTKNTYGYAAEAASYDMGLRSYMVSVFKNMGIALSITGVVAFLLAISPQLMMAIFGTPLQYVVMFAPLAMVFFVFPNLMSYSLGKAMAMLGIFSGLMGASIAPIFHIYTGESITQVFFITFGAMALYGYTSKKDLTSMGSFMIMGLFGIIIASLVNLFLASSAMQFVVSVLSVIIFTGLTAWDVQKIKYSYNQIAGSSIESNAAVYGALTLYMDFVNLFLSLLQLFGQRRDQ